MLVMSGALKLFLQFSRWWHVPYLVHASRALQICQTLAHVFAARRLANNAFQKAGLRSLMIAAGCQAQGFVELSIESSLFAHAHQPALGERTAGPLPRRHSSTISAGRFSVAEHCASRHAAQPA